MTGAAGQNGFYLVERLIGEGVDVHSAVRDEGRADELRALLGPGSLVIHGLDINDSSACGDLVGLVRPHELYDLAGLSSVSDSFRDPMETWWTNAD